MITRILIRILIILSFVLPQTTHAASIEITGPEMEIKGNDIIVNSGISNVNEFDQAIKSGISKEIVFTIELLKAWRFWPDEFVVSRKIARV